VHLVGFTIGIYYDARTYERQIFWDIPSIHCIITTIITIVIIIIIIIIIIVVQSLCLEL
jgi:hypothetical protein